MPVTQYQDITPRMLAIRLCDSGSEHITCPDCGYPTELKTIDRVVSFVCNGLGGCNWHLSIVIFFNQRKEQWKKMCTDAYGIAIYESINGKTSSV